MSRRGGGFYDPTLARLIRRQARDDVDKLLASLRPSERIVLELYLGLSGEPPMNFSQIGPQLGIDAQEAGKLMSRALSSIWHPSRAVLDDREGQAAAMRALDDQIAAASNVRTFCAAHGYTIGMGYTCEMCPCQLPQKRTGRPRRYCSNPCRQAASRKRRKELPAG